MLKPTTEHLSYEERLAKLELFSVGKRKLQRNFSVLKGLIRKTKTFHKDL